MLHGYLGYQEGSEPLWWWKVAQHLDEANGALVNAMVHNLDEQTAVFSLQDKFREAQVILLTIFEMKGLVPTSVRGAGVVAADPLLSVPEPGAPRASEVSPGAARGSFELVEPFAPSPQVPGGVSGSAHMIQGPIEG